MEIECRRVVTGLSHDGKSTVIYDTTAPLTTSAADDSARQEDRAGNASLVLWSTKGFPVDNNDPVDTAAIDVPTAKSDGTVFRIVSYAPGVAPRHHRTLSIDYAIVLSGSIQLELEETTVQLNARDVLVQRGTIHNWANTSAEPCVIAFILIGAQPVIDGDTALRAVG